MEALKDDVSAQARMKAAGARRPDFSKAGEPRIDKLLVRGPNGKTKEKVRHIVEYRDKAGRLLVVKSRHGLPPVSEAARAEKAAVSSEVKAKAAKEAAQLKNKKA